VLWLAVESGHQAPELAAGAKSGPPTKAKKTAPLPLPAGSEPAPTGATVTPSPALTSLNAPDALPDEALLTFRTAEALAAFRERAASLGLEMLGHDVKLRSARVRFNDTDGLMRDLREHAE